MDVVTFLEEYSGIELLPYQKFVGTINPEMIKIAIDAIEQIIRLDEVMSV